MGNLKIVIGQMGPFEKICAVAFLFFATISCVATAQSLYLTLDLDGPRWLIFSIAFIFAFFLYILTSFCFKIIIDSLNYSLTMKREERRRNLFLGLLGVILFWLFCSMTTNTHSLFYQKIIERVEMSELSMQKSVYEEALSKSTSDIEEERDRKKMELESSIQTKINLFIAEINHTDRLGYGPEAKEILKDILSDCGKGRDEFDKYYLDTKQKNTSVEERKRIKDHFLPQIENLKQQAVNELIAKYDIQLKRHDKEKVVLNSRINKINDTESYLQKNPSQSMINIARKVIDDGYNQPDYKDLMLNKVEVLKDPKAGHTDKNVKYYKIYKTERLHNVFKVWGDLLSSKMRNLDYDIKYWILISIIIDIAGLSFFGIAFHRKQ